MKWRVSHATAFFITNTDTAKAKYRFQFRVLSSEFRHASYVETNAVAKDYKLETRNWKLGTVFPS